MTRDISKFVIIAVVGLSLVFLTGTAFSAQVVGKTSTQTAPIQSNTQTAPLPSNTQTVPLPSTTREYQQVNKPPVKTLDIPDYDLAGELRIDSAQTKKVGSLKKVYIYYRVALMNKGKKKVARDVWYRVRMINTTNQTSFRDFKVKWLGDSSVISNDYWRIEGSHNLWFYLDYDGTPHTINDVKMIVDIDPDNTFGEAQRFRGNNRCIATW